MSLATTGGLGGAGAAGGGLMMAHQVNAVGRAAPPPQPNAQTMSGAPPPSAAALGADLLDKSQGLNLKTVKNLSHLPIVALDLHGSDARVAYFPKKPEDPSKGALPVAVQSVATSITLTKGDASHKTLKKFLAKSRTYLSLKRDSMGKAGVTLPKPHLWMGLRRLDDATKSEKASITVEESTGPAISEESPTAVFVANSTLDCTVPVGDDLDRVVFKVRLSDTKKAVSILPEEAVEMIAKEAQLVTASKLKFDPEDEEIEDFPMSVAVPAWASTDASIEALMDAIGGSGTVFQRNVAGLAGALLPSVDGSALLDRLNKVRSNLQKEHQKRLAKDPGAVFEDDMTLIVFSMTPEGLEATAAQVSNADLNNISCLFGDIRVVSSVSYRHDDPVSIMQKCAKELEENIDRLAPEMDGPTGIVFCGSSAEQKQLAKKWESAKNEEWKKVPVFQTEPDSVAMGAAVLGAVSHGRLSRLRQEPGKKTRAHLALKVQNVAPVAVGIRMNYHGGKANQWEDVKTLFDFDRQIPAGPHAFDFSAAENVVRRGGKADSMDDEEFEKAIKSNEGAKGIPLREQAALDFQIQVLQKWTRDGEWKNVGNVIEPLVKKVEDRDGNTSRVACESVTFEVSLGVSGMLATHMVGERQSVAVANKSARNSAIRYYVGMVFAVLFFGGFLFKSYWDEHVLERDAKRLLAFYKHVVPGSLHDGDEHSARYTAYKYRNKKDKLWRNLERKYGEPVLQTAEYEALFAEQASATAEEETLDLDDEEEQPESQEL